MRYAITLLSLGILVSSLACAWGRWWHSLHWFSFSCLALAAGYAGLGPRVFGKRPDGRIPMWSKFIHLPFMLCSFVLWHIARMLSRENPTNAVTDDLIIGRRLCASELPEGVTNYVDLTAEMEDPEQIRTSSCYINLPILDADAPSSNALRLAIAQLKPGTTYVHCAQGHGRTALFALALLAERRRIRSIDQGMNLLKSARPGIGLNRIQEKFIRDVTAATRASGD